MSELPNIKTDDPYPAYLAWCRGATPVRSLGEFPTWFALEIDQNDFPRPYGLIEWGEELPVVGDMVIGYCEDIAYLLRVDEVRPCHHDGDNENPPGHIVELRRS